MEMLERLKQQASVWPELKLAVLFGSTARGKARPKSDVDLGILLDPYSPELRFRVEADLARAAGQPVDVILLDGASPLLRFEITREGVLLFQREDHLWTDFKAKAMVDWWDWAPTFRLIAAGVARRLRSESGYWQTRVPRRGAWLDAVEEIFSQPAVKVRMDVKSRDLAAFYLFLAIQECINLAAYWLAVTAWDIPDVAGESFNLLAEHGEIDGELAMTLRGAVGLRNRIMHGYAFLDHEWVQQEYRNIVEAIRRFIVVSLKVQ